MIVVKKEFNVWGGTDNRLTTFLGDDTPPLDLVTAAFALAFTSEGLLLVRSARPGRDWEAPGGHRDDGESPEQAALREAMEEASAEIELVARIGYVCFEDLHPVQRDFLHPYPQSYMIFYAAQVTALHEFVPNSETSERRIWRDEELHASRWWRNNQAFHQRARELTAEKTTTASH